MSFTWHDFLNPELSLTAQAFIRAAYGVLLLGTVVMAARHGRRFFLSERWGGYAKSSPDVDWIQNPTAYPWVIAAWCLSAAFITAGVCTVLAALANLLLCRYFFVRMRWKGALRGMGAPGFMTYWLAAAVFLLEYTTTCAPRLRSLALLVIQADYAFIMLSSGIYKLTAGYLRNQGMEWGMVNPQWGYWHKFFRNVSPRHWLFWVLNQGAWSLEVLAAVLMLLPPTRFYGGALMIVSFVFIATQIRLGLLCEMVILGGLMFVPAATIWDQGLATLTPTWLFQQPEVVAVPAGLNLLVAAALWAYLALLPVAHAGLFWNFYAHKAFPRPLQRALEAYTNFFGIIIWRVFSVDHTNFCIQIYRQCGDDAKHRTLVSRYDEPWGRFDCVGESIAITCVFTSLKYYPSNSNLFIERLLRYARTLPCAAGEVLVFQYLSLRKASHRFEAKLVAEYIVDCRENTVVEHSSEGETCIRRADSASPLHEGVRPGSYVALQRTA